MRRPGFLVAWWHCASSPGHTQEGKLWTSMHATAQLGSVKLLQFLIGEGADVNVKNLVRLDR